MTKCKLPKKKKKLTGMAYRYECAWHKCFYDIPDWKKEFVIHNPHGRQAEEVAHEAVKLAESDADIPCMNTGEYISKTTP